MTKLENFLFGILFVALSAIAFSSVPDSANNMQFVGYLILAVVSSIIAGVHLEKAGRNNKKEGKD